MQYDKQQVAEKLVRWERFLGSYHLPEWEELPQIRLYLDQVIALVNNYLGFFVYDPTEEKKATHAIDGQQLCQAPPDSRTRAQKIWQKTYRAFTDGLHVQAIAEHGGDVRDAPAG